jgi:hypothetical protein
MAAAQSKYKQAPRWALLFSRFPELGQASTRSRRKKTSTSIRNKQNSDTLAYKKLIVSLGTLGGFAKELGTFEGCTLKGSQSLSLLVVSANLGLLFELCYESVGLFRNGLVVFLSLSSLLGLALNLMMNNKFQEWKRKRSQMPDKL